MLPPPPDDLLAQLGVSHPVFIEAPGRASIWKVDRAGRVAALKVYDDLRMGNEAAGVAMMADRQGAGVVEVYGQVPGAFVMEWLDGPALGDLTRAGRDAEARAVLVTVFRALHADPKPAQAGTPHLREWVQDLLDVQRGAGCSEALWQAISAAQALAVKLLAKSGPDHLLHGDLHHDNIRQGARGWTAFDAKGVMGPLAYDLANTFRNPKGAPLVVADPARARGMAQAFGTGLGLEAAHLLDWAAVKCALSIAWRSKGAIADDWEGENLSMFLSLAAAAH